MIGCNFSDNEADSETDDDDEDLDEEKVTNQDENVEKIENLNAIPLPAQETWISFPFIFILHDDMCSSCEYLNKSWELVEFNF